MVKFDYVEEYIEVMAGYRDPVTKKPNSNWFYEFKPIINLARYDVSVLESMAVTVSQNQALTERQAELACKIILNYRRQLSNKLVDVSPVEKPMWRVPLRKMDYSKRVYVENDTILLKFPYSTELIDSIRTFSKESQGSAKWNRDTKLWEVALTEYNLSWVYAWAEVNKFDIDSTIQTLMSKITDVETAGYSIELYAKGDVLDIRNCPDSLRDYIISKVGGFSVSNLLQLVDLSSILGYTVETAIYEAIVAEYGHRFYTLATNREIKINPGTLLTSNDFDSLLDYADITERWPVVLYEPDLSGRMLTKLRDRYGDDFADDGKYIHTVKPIRDMATIPMVISSAGMVFGGDKQLMLQRAEKIAYCATDVYNKKAKSKVKPIG